MSVCRIISSFLILVVSMKNPAEAGSPAHSRPEARAVTAADVARLPAARDGVVPAAFAFTPDGKALTYLKSEIGQPRAASSGGSSSPAGTPARHRPAARRRRHRRQHLRGREPPPRAAAAPRDRHHPGRPRRGGRRRRHPAPGRPLPPARRRPARTDHRDTPAPRSTPSSTRDGTKVAFVRDDELFVIDLATKKETQLTHGAGDGLTHGLAEFIAQEEMDRSSGFWWSPDGARIAYQETDERHIPLYTIVHQGGEDYSVETHRYPFAGDGQRQGPARRRRRRAGGETRWLDLAEADEDVYLARVDWESPESLLVQVLVARPEVAEALPVRRRDRRRRRCSSRRRPTPGSTCTTTSA